MLERALADTDPETTGVVVLTAKVLPPGAAQPEKLQLDVYEQELLSEVVRRAERVGKEVKPLVVPTNNPLHAVLRVAKELQAHELIMGASNRYTADEQIEQIAFYWISLHHGEPAPLTVHIVSRDRDVALDLGGGNRIPRVSERHARNIAELRAAGVGVRRVLMIHDGTPASGDLFEAVLTMLDPQVALALVPVMAADDPTSDHVQVQQDQERARRLRRELAVLEVNGDVGPAVVRLAREGPYDLVVVPLPADLPAAPHRPLDARSAYVLRHAHCPVFLAGTPVIPHEVVDTRPPTTP